MFAKFERDAFKYISRYCYRWVSTNCHAIKLFGMLTGLLYFNYDQHLCCLWCTKMIKIRAFCLKTKTKEQRYHIVLGTSIKHI